MGRKKRNKRMRQKKLFKKDLPRGPQHIDFIARLNSGERILLEIKYPRVGREYTGMRDYNNEWQISQYIQHVVSFREQSSDQRKELDAPKFVVGFLTLLLRKNETEGGVGDVIEKYINTHQRLGKYEANRYLFWEITHSVLPLVIRFIKTAICLALGEWVKKHIF